MKNKRFLSLLLVLSILFSFSAPAYAATIETASDGNETLLLEDATIYTKKTASQYFVLTVPDNSEPVEINFSFIANPSTVYQLYIPKDTMNLSVASSINWDTVQFLCQENISSAKQINFVIEDVTYDEPIEITNMRSSVSADLMEDLADLRGNEYEWRKVHETTYQGENIKIYERMDFRIYEAGYKRWSTGEDILTLGSFITGVMGYTVTSATLGAFGIIFCVLPQAISTISGSGKLNKYNCCAFIGRHASINDSEYAYTMTDNVYAYLGYDDADLNSTERAAIVSSTLDHYYTDGSSYYYDFDAQVEDAYEMFTRIGQMD